MSVVIETTLGDITVDLYLKERPNTCLNFLKLCKIKYYNLCLFHKIERNFIAQTGDPTGTGRGGESIFCHLYGEQAKYFDVESKPRLKHEKHGTLSMVNNGNNMNGSQFFITLGENITYLDEDHSVFGEVSEGFDILLKLNEAICDENNRPYQDIRITHTVILNDPFDDPANLSIPDASPEPTKEQLESNYIGADEEIDDTKGKSMEEIEEKIKESEAKARATILEMVGDLPDVDVKPPENVLFVCKLNPVTTSEDLEIIFSRFGTILSCEVIKDKKTGESLQYSFIEFEKEEDCENAYFKMDNVLIDDRRIHVDFSQSVSKMNFQMDNKFNKQKSGKSQNLVIRNQVKNSDGYDMVFDMEDVSAEPSAEKKKKYQSSKTLESSNKGASKSYDHDKYKKHSSTSEKERFEYEKRKRQSISPETQQSKYDSNSYYERKHYASSTHSRLREEKNRLEKNYDLPRKQKQSFSPDSNKHSRNRSKSPNRTSNASYHRDRYSSSPEHHVMERSSTDKRYAKKDREVERSYSRNLSHSKRSTDYWSDKMQNKSEKYRDKNYSNPTSAENRSRTSKKHVSSSAHRSSEKKSTKHISKDSSSSSSSSDSDSSSSSSSSENVSPKHRQHISQSSYQGKGRKFVSASKSRSRSPSNVHISRQRKVSPAFSKRDQRYSSSPEFQTQKEKLKRIGANEPSHGSNSNSKKHKSGSKRTTSSYDKHSSRAGDQRDYEQSKSSRSHKRRRSSS